MEFLPLIIGVIVAIAVGASKNKKSRQGGDPSVPAGNDENFPFPQNMRDLFDFGDQNEEDLVDQRSEYQSVEDVKSLEEGVAMTSIPVQELTAAHIAMNVPISQRKAGIIVEAPIEVERSISSQRAAFDFDLRSAVIAAEVLKPKYNDNI